MLMSLFNYINNYSSIPISEKDFETLQSYFIHRKIRKRQLFLQEGDICKYFAFILNGAMRKYYIDEKGTEHMVNLYVENWWVGDRESFTTETPSIYTIDAWEDCEVLIITNENSLKITSEFPAFNEMRLNMDLKNNIATQKRITSFVSCTAEKRYSDFINNHPEFLTRFPQHIIASYLGITKETLSRIRNQVSQK